MSVNESVQIAILKKRLQQTKEAIQRYEKTQAQLDESLKNLLQTRDAILAEFKKRGIDV